MYQADTTDQVIDEQETPQNIDEPETPTEEPNPRGLFELMVLEVVERPYDYKKRMLSSNREYLDDDEPESLGRIYDLDKSAQVYAHWCRQLAINQGGFYLESLFVTDKGNWFLYSDANNGAVDRVFCRQAGVRITPIGRVDAFYWLEDRGAGVDVFEKYFPDMIELA